MATFPTSLPRKPRALKVHKSYTFESPSFESLFPPALQKSFLFNQQSPDLSPAPTVRSSSPPPPLPPPTVRSPSPPPPSPSPPPSPLLLPPCQGTYEADRILGCFNMEWPSLAAFKSWKAEVEKEQGIELLLAKKIWDGDCFEDTLYYVCGRHGTGGCKVYVKKNPQWNRKIPAKRTGCPCKLTVKTYPEIETILGQYQKSHNHEIGNSNLRFIRISADTRELIAGMLRSGVAPENIVCQIRFVI